MMMMTCTALERHHIYMHAITVARIICCYDVAHYLAVTRMYMCNNNRYSILYTVPLVSSCAQRPDALLLSCDWAKATYIYAYIYFSSKKKLTYRNVANEIRCERVHMYINAFSTLCAPNLIKITQSYLHSLHMYVHMCTHVSALYSVAFSESDSLCICFSFPYFPSVCRVRCCWVFVAG